MRFSRNLKAETKVDLVPMIDVVFQLVLFFLVTSSFRVTGGLEVDIPSSGTQEALSRDQVIIELTADGELFLNGDEVTMTTLGPAVDQVTGGDLSASLILRASEQSPYGSFIAIMDQLKGRGYEQLGLETTAKEP